MPETPSQKRTVGRVMHEFKHGELKGPDGARITDRKQAVAIGLSEAGASDRVAPAQNRRNRKRTTAKERAGGTAGRQGEEKAAVTRTRSDLYAEARRRGVPGRSKMNKAQLEAALAG